MDLVSADAVIRIAQSGAARSSPLFTSPRKDIKWDEVAVGAAYVCFIRNGLDWLLKTTSSFLFNPFTIATCLARPTTVFTNCAILCAIAAAVGQRPVKSMLALAIAAYFSLYPALLLPPLILLCHDQSVGTKLSLTNTASKLLSFFLGSLAWLLATSYMLTGQSWEFIRSTYGVHLLLPDLTPNVGLWWYFFIEMFDPFRAFFLGVFWLHLVSYVGGLCFRLRKQPLFVLTTLIGIFAVFQPYPSVADASLYFSLVPLYSHIFPCRFRYLDRRLLARADRDSDALYFLRDSDRAVCDSAGACLLLLVDIRRIWQCKFLLCDNSGVESRLLNSRRRVFVCSTQG